MACGASWYQHRLFYCPSFYPCCFLAGEHLRTCSEQDASSTSITVSQPVTDSFLHSTRQERFYKTRLNCRNWSKNYEYSFIQMSKHHLFCQMHLSVYANFTIFARNKMADDSGLFCFHLFSPQKWRVQVHYHPYNIHTANLILKSCLMVQLHHIYLDWGAFWLILRGSDT